MEADDQRTAHRCDNCQAEGLTARLDIGKGVATRLCAPCWARLMAWRQQQNARQKKPAFVILPWPLTEGVAPTRPGADAAAPPQRHDA
jgi:hypothetical protein